MMPALAEFPKIDAHVHLNSGRTYLLNTARRYNFSLLTINTEVPDFPSLEDQHAYANNLQARSPNLVHHASTVSTDRIGSAGWVKQTIAQIKSALSEGACGVKFWKNIGMDLQRNDGSFIMLDAPELQPILAYLEEKQIPVLGHQGEPRNCWLPLDDMTVQGDRDYFSQNPRYHMYLHPEYPDYWEHINARDRVLERHPSLRFVGLHLASLEWNLDEIALRLDKYPNLAIDLAERMPHLYYHAAQNRDRVIAFFEKYQDRIIYGTDFIDNPALSEDTIEKELKKRWISQWEFLATNKHLSSAQIDDLFQGLDLSNSILKKIYYSNAVNWYNL